MEKVPKIKKEKKVEVISAIVEPNASGINIRAKNEKGEIEGYFVPADVWGTIPYGKNPSIELEKIARIFNGFRECLDGSWIEVENFKPIKITLVTE